MEKPALYRIFLMSGAALALGVTSPLAAQSFEELETLSDASSDEAGGIQAARGQASRGEYLEALATLERVLAQNPKSREARLIHAIYLCRVDDRRGGLVEIDKLKTKHYGKEVLEEAREMCAPKEAS
jgi:Tfp pilus assembly protein PilF